jgi:two-component system cell cycle sensor histidine kinase PleC
MAGVLTKRAARSAPVTCASPSQMTGAASLPVKRPNPWPAENSPGFDAAKSNFLAAMSHELRTPLNAIIGFAEILDAEVFGPMPVTQYGQYVRDILQSGRCLLQIVEDVLEISRAEAGELVLHMREVELQPLVAEICRAFDRQARARSIGIVAEVSSDLIVKVDPEKFRRIMTCLIGNSIKFSADGSTVRVIARLESRGLLKIRISDEGIGMNPKAIERAFGPFVQLDPILSRRFEGSGLGLSLARSLVQLHGGSLELESVPGEGTTATIALPAYAHANRHRVAS